MEKGTLQVCVILALPESFNHWIWYGCGCGQVKLLNQIRTHQIVAAPSINNYMCSMVLDDKETLEQVVAL
jgi:hypothetical protein